MRILIVSHNVFDYSSSMGKTLSKIFENWDDTEIAQLYIHNEEPCYSNICKDYYKITDKDVIKAVFNRRKCGKCIRLDNDYIKQEKPISMDSFEQRIYQKGRKRTSTIYFCRDFLWSIGKWKTKELKEWIISFCPDVVFLASGDYSFIYKIGLYIAEIAGAPLITMCFDDFYLNNQNNASLLGRIRHRRFMTVVRKTIRRSSMLITVCESMAKAYNELFDIKCCALYTPAELREYKIGEIQNRIAYFGSLGLGRNEQLIDIGKAILALSSETGIRCLDVFTSELRDEILSQMTESNGIMLHKAVSQDEVFEIMSSCISVIHTESFAPKFFNRTRFSISTKIAEALANAPCLFVYGPKGIASVDYLYNNKAAIVATDKMELTSKLRELMTNQDLRMRIMNNARSLVKMNHDAEKNRNLIKKWIQDSMNTMT